MDPKRIIVHHSGTRLEWMGNATIEDQVAEIRRWHTSRPLRWADIGYHFVIGRSGAVRPGRPINRRGAHVRGQNHDSIGICLIGGHGSAETDRFEENFTQAQGDALRDLIECLREKTGEPLPLSGHNWWAPKACPGFDVEELGCAYGPYDWP